NEVLICSFNIKFLGFYGDKRHQELVDVLRPCDIAVIQELVSTPENMPHLLSDAGTPLSRDPEAKDFFERMTNGGFKFILSPEDTGPNRNHVNNTESEWFVAFYKPGKVEVWQDYTRFIDEPLVSHRVFARVPFAFGFKAKNSRGQTKNDFVLVSVHLASDGQ